MLARGFSEQFLDGTVHTLVTCTPNYRQKLRICFFSKSRVEQQSFRNAHDYCLLYS